MKLNETIAKVMDLKTKLDAAVNCPLIEDDRAAEEFRNQYPGALMRLGELIIYEEKALDSSRSSLFHLLSNIHMDGGKYIRDNGIDKSCADAALKVTHLITAASQMAKALKSIKECNHPGILSCCCQFELESALRKYQQLST